MNIKNLRLLAKKEWKESFNSPMPYIFFTVFSLVTGWFFTTSLFLTGQASLGDFFAPLPLLLVFFLPAFTMRLLAEEYKTGTIETLSTLPLEDTEIILGKYLAALMAWGTLLGLSLFYGLLLCLLGPLDLGQTTAGFLGALLLGGLYSAAGLFASSLTRSQVVGFLLGFLFCFALFLAGKAAHYLPGLPGSLLTFLGVDVHYESFLKGVVDTRDVLYFVSGQILFLAGTLASFNSRRWR
jgi:ABC-2 type transport system permease protein